MNETTFLMVVSLETPDTVEMTLKNIQSIGGTHTVLIYDRVNEQTDSFQIFSERFSHHAGLRIYEAKKRNQGLTVSLNQGLECVETHFTSRVDPGDMSSTNRIANSLRAFDENPDLIICGCTASLISEDGKAIYQPRARNHRFVNKQLLAQGNPLAHGSITFVTKAIQKINGYDAQFKFSQDYDLYERTLGEYGEKSILLLGTSHYQRIVSPHSISFNKAREQSEYSDQIRSRLNNLVITDSNLKQKTLKKRLFTLGANGQYQSLLDLSSQENCRLLGVAYILKMFAIRSMPILSRYLYRN